MKQIHRIFLFLTLFGVLAYYSIQTIKYAIKSNEILESEKSADYYSKIGFGLDKKLEFKLIKDDSLIDSLVIGDVIFTNLDTLQVEKY